MSLSISLFFSHLFPSLILHLDPYFLSYFLSDLLPPGASTQSPLTLALLLQCLLYLRFLRLSSSPRGRTSEPLGLTLSHLLFRLSDYSLHLVLFVAPNLAHFFSRFAI